MTLHTTKTLRTIVLHTYIYTYVEGHAGFYSSTVGVPELLVLLKASSRRDFVDHLLELLGPAGTRKCNPLKPLITILSLKIPYGYTILKNVVFVHSLLMVIL